MKTHEISPADQVDASVHALLDLSVLCTSPLECCTPETRTVRHLWVQRMRAIFQCNGRIESEGKCSRSFVLEEVREQYAVVECQEHLQDLSTLRIRTRAVDGLESAVSMAICYFSPLEI